VKVLKKAAKEIVKISVSGPRFDPGTTQNEIIIRSSVIFLRLKESIGIHACYRVCTSAVNPYRLRFGSHSTCSV